MREPTNTLSVHLVVETEVATVFEKTHSGTNISAEHRISCVTVRRLHAHASP